MKGIIRGNNLTRDVPTQSTVVATNLRKECNFSEIDNKKYSWHKNKLTNENNVINNNERYLKTDRYQIL